MLKNLIITNYRYDKEIDLIVLNDKLINNEEIIYWKNLDPYVCLQMKMVYEPLNFLKYTTKQIVIIGTGNTSDLLFRLIHIITDKKILFSNSFQKKDDVDFISFENLDLNYHFAIIGSIFVDEIKSSLEFLGFKNNKDFVIPLFLDR